MASQGLLSVVSGDTVIMKVVAGRNGEYVKDLADIVESSWPMSIDEMFQAAEKLSIGAHLSLVVISATEVRSNNSDNVVSGRYRETFSNPRFNPRWEWGTADYVEIVRVG